MNLRSLAPGQQPGREPQTGMEHGHAGTFVRGGLCACPFEGGESGQGRGTDPHWHVLPTGTLLRPLRHAAMGPGLSEGKEPGLG